MPKILLEHAFEGPFNAGCYDVALPNGRRFRVSGKAASMVSLILSGYQLRDDFMPLDAFTHDSLAPGRMDARAVSEDEVAVDAQA